MNKQVEAIKAEVKKNMANELEWIKDQGRIDYSEGMVEAYAKIIDFINTMEEPKIEDLNENELSIREIYGHLDGILNNMDRMTSGNFMHNKAATKLSVKIIKDRLESLGINEI